MKKHHDVHGGTRKSASRWKKELALALCVSLWMAGGGVAGAADYDAHDGETISGTGHQNDSIKVADNYTVTITGTVKSVTGANTGIVITINGGNSKNDVSGGFALDGSTVITNNTVTVTSGGRAAYVYGGQTRNTATGDITINKVYISGDETLVKGVYGGYAYVTQGGYVAGSAKQNEVHISGGKVRGGSVFGGYTNGTSKEASGNLVEISGGTVESDVHGNGGDIYGGYSPNGAANNNVVNILKDGIELKNVHGGKGTSSSGNTINIAAKNVTVTSIQDMQNLSFYLPSTIAANNTMLTITGGNASNLTGVTIGAAALTGVNLSKGDSVTLLKNANGLTGTAATTTLTQEYTMNPVAGVAIDATLKSSLALNGAQTALTYTVTENKASTLTFSDVEWKNGGALIEHATDATKNVDFNGADVDTTKLAFTNPGSAGGTMTLIANAGALANPANTVSQSYALNPVDGLSIDAALNGSVALSGNDLIYSVTSNQANKLTFGDVEWKDTGALLTRPANITFAGADVDTANINFTNIKSLEANKKMTLVSDFGNSVGTITGTKYKVGSTLEGTGKASLVGSDLIFTAETGTGGKPDVTPQEQTHNAVMGAEVGMAALSAGNDFVGAATEGLSLASNVGADGVSSFAQMGGGSMRQETGSHVDTHTWNAILALGHQNKKERGTFEYGAFFEYGSGNYTTHNGDERGDGSMHYTGGGLLAKYTRANGVYVEGSLRAGTVHDDARNVLRDVRTRIPYSYETNAPYMGFHLGVGKEIPFDDIHSLDVYGKYFYNRRNGVSFDAGGHYDLDAVTSQVVRIGARYTVKQGKWNFYGGAAYEHELDGKATGTADGVAIRGADTSGASFRGEIGATMKPGENSPWSLDLNVAGFAGKKQGFTGGVSVAFMF